MVGQIAGDSHEILLQGIPNGAGAVAHFLLAIGLSLLIWKGLREKRWALVGAAILVAIAWDIVQMLAARLPALGAPHSFESPVSPEILESVLGLVVVALLYWRAPICWRRSARLPEDALSANPACFPSGAIKAAAKAAIEAAAACYALAVRPTPAFAMRRRQVNESATNLPPYGTGRPVALRPPPRASKITPCGASPIRQSSSP